MLLHDLVDRFPAEPESLSGSSSLADFVALSGKSPIWISLTPQVASGKACGFRL